MSILPPSYRHRGRALRSVRLLRSLLAPGILLLATATPAIAVPTELFVDPVRSSLRIESTSELTFDFGFPFGPVTVPLDPPVGTGALLPDGTTGDGFRTFLEGSVLADLTASNVQIIDRRTAFSGGDSGSFLPGPPGDQGTPAPAELAVSFDDPGLVIAGTAALRDTISTITLDGPGTLVPVGAGLFEFDATGSLTLLQGVVDFDTNLAELSGRGFLPFTAGANAPTSPGTLEDLGGGFVDLIIPLDVSLTLAGDLLQAGVPITIDLDLGGQLVATNIPEPGTLLLVGVGVIGMAARARLRRT